MKNIEEEKKKNSFMDVPFKDRLAKKESVESLKKERRKRLYREGKEKEIKDTKNDLRAKIERIKKALKKQGLPERHYHSLYYLKNRDKETNRVKRWKRENSDKLKDYLDRTRAQRLSYMRGYYHRKKEEITALKKKLRNDPNPMKTPLKKSIAREAIRRLEKEERGRRSSDLVDKLAKEFAKLEILKQIKTEK